MIEILGGGVLNAVQDRGRRGWLASGVSMGGAMDRPALEAANCLVGNARSAAGIEVQLFPFRVRALKDIMIAVTGADCAAAIDGEVMPPWWGRTMREGQTLALKAPSSGARAYVAFSGGVDVPSRLGSRSTDLRAGFGGHEGRGLARGDRLPLGEAPATRSPQAGWGVVPRERVWGTGQAPPIRVIPAAEYLFFSDEARQTFANSAWRVTRDANRMGYRLSGPELSLDRPLELFSHGIVPGTIQVLPSGQPIIQLADANTCGGYPKIAAVIEADLWRLAQAQTDAELSFEVVEADQAVEALRRQDEWLREVEAARATLR